MHSQVFLNVRVMMALRIISDKPCPSGFKSNKIHVNKKPPLKERYNQFGSNDSKVTSMMLDQEEQIRSKEEKIDDGTYKPSDSEAALISKLNKHRQTQIDKSERERRRKEMLRIAEKKEYELRAKAYQKKKHAQMNRALVNNVRKERTQKYKDWMESRERSGAMMDEEEKSWRKWDETTVNNKAIYQEKLTTVGTKEYKERKQTEAANYHAELKQQTINNEFNNTRYQGNDIDIAN